MRGRVSNYDLLKMASGGHASPPASRSGLQGGGWAVFSKVPDACENDYFGETYLWNDRWKQFRGYTMDILFDEAMRWSRRAVSEGGQGSVTWTPWQGTGPMVYRRRITNAWRSGGPRRKQLSGFDPEGVV